MSLAVALGAQTIAETIGSFVDYLETSIAVHERDGSHVGQVQVGNDYCRMLLEAPVSGDGGTSAGLSPCITAGREVALRAMQRRQEAELICPGGSLLCASPVFSNGVAIGACVGTVSAAPTETKAVSDIAAHFGVDADKLKQAALTLSHKPDYLYAAGRRHIRRLATALERLYDDATEREAIIARTTRLYEQLRISEERYRDTVAGAADWMYTTDDDMVVLDCNEAMASDLGYDRDDILGHPITDFIVPWQHELLAGDDKLKAAREGGCYWTELAFLDRDGRRFTHQVKTVAVFNRVGDVTQWRSVGRDITENKKAEEEINLLLTAVESSKEGVIVTDMDGNLISINSSGARMLGKSVEEMAGSHMGEFWSPDNPQQLADSIFKGTLAGGWEGQMRYRCADGSNLPVHVSSAPVKGRDGEIQAMVGIFRDISEEQRMTEEILRRNRELAVINAISTTSAKSVELEAMLQDCVDTLVKTMNYDAGVIYIAEPETGVVSCRAQCGLPEDAGEYLDTDGARQATASLTGRQPVFIDDAKSRTGADSTGGDEPWFTSSGSVPIISKGRGLGVLTVFAFERHTFDQQEQSLLLSVGKNLGVTVESARLFDDVARGKAEWESTFDALTNGVSIHDRDFNIMRANKSLSKLLGISNEELIGRKCYEVFHGRTEPIPGCPHVKACETGRNATVRLVEPYLDATVSVSADPIFNGNGTVIGSAHDVRDITEEERLREQLSQSERLRALGEMAGGVAHDFNNYLTIMLGNAQLLLTQSDAGLSDDDRESLRTIERAAIDAGETVRRIQEFTRVRTTRAFTTVEVNKVILNAIDVSRPRWKDEAIARNAEIEILTQLGNVPPVNANASELGEVMMNLILNAADALPDGGYIEVESREDGGWVEVSIADDGTGMDGDTVKRIFDPFFTTKGPSGVGLGLSVAYGIVNRHGGEITVDSSRGKGTRFSIKLPVATVADLTGEKPEQLSLDSERSARVLVIDDMEMVRTLLSNLLESMGHMVVTAASGSLGVETFAETLAQGRQPFDLVMTDLGMPGMSGWEVADAIKQMSPETPVALITGWGDQLDQERMAASNIDSVVAKPFTVDQVRHLITDSLKSNGDVR